MKIEVKPIEDGSVRFDRVTVGVCFRTTDGVYYMKTDPSRTGGGRAAHLKIGVVTFFDSGSRVLPVEAKVVIGGDE